MLWYKIFSKRFSDSYCKVSLSSIKERIRKEEFQYTQWTEGCQRNWGWWEARELGCWKRAICSWVISSVTQSYLALCNSMDSSCGLPVIWQLCLKIYVLLSSKQPMTCEIWHPKDKEHRLIKSEKSEYFSLCRNTETNFSPILTLIKYPSFG